MMSLVARALRRSAPSFVRCAASGTQTHSLLLVCSLLLGGPSLAFADDSFRTPFSAFSFRETRTRLGAIQTERIPTSNPLACRSTSPLGRSSRQSRSLAVPSAVHRTP